MVNLTTFLERYQRDKLSFFPVPYQAKKAVIEWKQYQERRPTPEEIASWDNGHKTNIAVVCGKVSDNLVVLDCDTPERFYELATIVCNHLDITDILDWALVSQTGKGLHIWLKTDSPVKSQKFPKLDIKGEGGYVIAPPSIHPSGAEYKFLNDMPIKHIKDLASIGININQKPASAEAPRNQPGWVTQLLAGVGEGSRNDAAIKLAGYFRHILPVDVTERILLDWNARNNPPLPANELQSVLTSVYSYPPRPPYFDSSKNTYGYTDPTPPLPGTPHPPYPPSPHENLALIGGVTYEERDTGVTESVTRTFAEVIGDWVKETSGWFSYEEIDRELGIKLPADKNNRRQVIKRLKAAGTIEAHPKNNKLLRYVHVAVRLIDFKVAGKRTPLAIRFPFGIERYFNTYPGNIVVLAGAADAGKTAWLLNFIRLNQYDFSIFYQSSEMGKEELASRLMNFDDIALDEWNFTAEERSKEFADVVRPDCINIIDYMELAGDFYNVADYMREIHDKLGTGICIIALQKKRGAELGRGGDFGLEKPRLYLTMDTGRCTIQKAKNWVDPTNNPNGLMIKYKLVAGCRFIVTEDWHKPDYE